MTSGFVRFGAPKTVVCNLGTSGTLAAHTPGAAYSGTFSVTNRVGDVTAELVSATPALPAGWTLAVNQATGVVTLAWPAAAPVSAPPLPNLDFETGTASWLLGNGWDVTAVGLVDSGTQSAKYNGPGQATIRHAQAVPVTPGTSITASARISKGANRQDFAGGAVVLEWLTAAGAPLSFSVGNVVNTGSSAFQTSTVTASAPAGAGLVRLGISGTRDIKGRAIDRVYADTVTWNHTYTLAGAPATDYAVVIRVRDGRGCEATLSQTVVAGAFGAIALSIWNKLIDWYSNETNGGSLVGRKAGIAQVFRSTGAGPHSVTNVSSPVGNAIQMNGGSSADNCSGYTSDYGVTSNLSYNSPVSLWTIMRVSAAPSWPCLFSMIRLSSDQAFFPVSATVLAQGVDTLGRLGIAMGDPSGGSSALINSVQPAQNSWFSYYTGQAIGSVRTAETSINGASIVAGSTRGLNSTTAPVQIALVGGTSGTTTSFFRDGAPPQLQFSEQAFFSQRLTQEEVNYLHNGGAFRTFDQLVAAAGVSPSPVLTASLLHFDGTNGSTTITDDRGLTWTANGNAQLSTAQSRFGTSSLALDGAGDFLTTPWVNNLSILGDFTVECFIRRTAAGRDAILTAYSGISNGIIFDIGPADELRLILGTGSFIICTSGASTVPVGSWVHVAAVKAGSTLRLFIGGTQVGTLAVTGTVADDTAGPVYVGTNIYDTTRDFAGHIDEFRFSRVARYTGTFTPPVAPFIAD